MEKDTVIKIALSAVLTVYLVFALAMTGNAGRADHYTELRIEVADSLGSGFVTTDDVSRECDGLISRIASEPRGSISLSELEGRLMELPVIERANVAALNDGSLRIDVEPMIPVARVFSPDGGSYTSIRQASASRPPPAIMSMCPLSSATLTPDIAVRQTCFRCCHT